MRQQQQQREERGALLDDIELHGMNLQQKQQQQQRSQQQQEEEMADIEAASFSIDQQQQQQQQQQQEEELLSVTIDGDAFPQRSSSLPSSNGAANRVVLRQSVSSVGVVPKTRFAPIPKKRASFSSSSRPSSPHEAESAAATEARNCQQRYVLFRTRSSRVNPGIEKQLSRLREEEEQQQHAVWTDSSCPSSPQELDAHEMPAGRYFDALHGPELEQLKETEDALLPLDQQWPFLLRFPISAFGIALGLGSQSILWKQLATMPSMTFLRAPLAINATLWCLAAMALASISATYALKALFFFEAVRREYHHPVRANFFFAPWIAAMFLALGAPPEGPRWLHPGRITWCLLMAPVLALELKIYGQWLSGGERRLSKVANPSTHLSVVGNFVGALLGARVGWREGAFFFWAIGLAHYVVVFVTLYQRLPTNESLPKELHPVFFLFIAAPSAASVAWERITGDFGTVSRIAFFIALFLFTSLVVRLNFFRGFRFSLAWWAYTFPMTAASIASIRYSMEIRTPATQVLAMVLSVISSLTVFLLFVSTMCHLFFWRTLFPNDLAIAITHRKKKKKKVKPRKKLDDESSNSSSTINGFSSHTRNSSVDLGSCFGKSDDGVIENGGGGDKRCTEV